MAENLNFEMEGSLVNEEHPEFGRYYRWEMASVACPDGWRLPEDFEWNILYNASSRNVLALLAKSVVAEATDELGFSALAAGFARTGFEYVGVYASFWSATSYDGGNAYLWLMEGNVAKLSQYGTKKNGYPVRCIKD